jgi:hypothetical protein
VDFGVPISLDLKRPCLVRATLGYLVSISLKNISPTFLERINSEASVRNPYFAEDIHSLEQAQRRFTKLSPNIQDIPCEKRLVTLYSSPLSNRPTRGDLIQTYKTLHRHYNLPLFVLTANVHLRGYHLKV